VFGASSNAHRLADIFAVRYALVPPGGAQPKWLRTVLRTPGGTVGVNATALPRAWVSYDWRRASTRGEALAATLASPTAALRNSPVIEGAPPPPAGPTPSSSAASVVDDSSDMVTVHAVAQRPGYVVLDDSAYPGWVATLDGRPTSWQPANENFRAVAIPAGRHTVVFRYRPASVRDGAIVSGLSILALLGLVLAGIGAARRHAVGPQLKRRGRQ
jgi:Bacterial membrane protein YfhO